jgi:KDO2-lipid IV(A) lauroyltransferase
VLGRPADDPLVLASTREAFRLYARYWHETFLVARWDDEEILRRFRVEGMDRLDGAIERGGGAILVLPHMGNWDAAGRYMAAAGRPVVSVVEQLRPRRLFELFLEHRRELRMDIAGSSGDGRVGRRLPAELASNRVVALVADRDLSGRGVEVDFFGRARRLPAGPALLALGTGAPLIVAAVYTTHGGWRCVLGPPISAEPTGDRRSDVATLTRRIAQELERAISAAPADWHLFQPGWPP